MRHTATYDRSLLLLAHAKKNYPHILVKSGIMVGLGETKDDVTTTLADLARIGCDIVTIGQYLQASRHKLRVHEFVHPDLFAEYEKIGKDLGIKSMYTGPFVRSSYNADLFVTQEKTK